LQDVSRIEAEAQPVSIPRGTETILVVEDEEDVRALTCEFLKSSGYSVLEAGNGAQALEVVASHAAQIQLVVSDMVMPKMSGALLAERLKTALPEVPVLLVSGYAEFSAASDTGSRPAAVLQKPFARASLVEKVREMLDANAARLVGSTRQ
jgi:CheY-like chemotaxis protein